MLPAHNLTPPNSNGPDYSGAVNHGLNAIAPDWHALVDQTFSTVSHFNGWLVGMLVAWVCFEIAMWLLERSKERKKPVQLELF